MIFLTRNNEDNLTWLSLLSIYHRIYQFTLLFDHQTKNDTS